MAIITENWLTATPTSGEVGTTSVSLSAQTAGVDRLYREAKITFRAGNLTKEVYVTQHSGAGDDYQQLAAPSVVTEISGGNIIATFTLPQGNPEGTVYYAKITKGSKEDYTESSTGFSSITQAPNNTLSYTINGEGDYYVNMAAVYGTMITPKSTKVTFQKIKLSAPTGLKAEEANKTYTSIRFDWNMYIVGSGPTTDDEKNAFTRFQYWYFKIEQASDRNLQNPPTGRAGLVSGTTTYPYFELQEIEKNSEYRFFLKAEANSNTYTDSDFVSINASPKPSPYYEITSDIQTVPINQIATVTFTPKNNAQNSYPEFYILTTCDIEVKQGSATIYPDAQGKFTLSNNAGSITIKNANFWKANKSLTLSANTYTNSNRDRLIADTSLAINMALNPNGVQSGELMIAANYPVDDTQEKQTVEITNIGAVGQSFTVKIIRTGGEAFDNTKYQISAATDGTVVSTPSSIPDSLPGNITFTVNPNNYSTPRSATVKISIIKVNGGDLASNEITINVTQNGVGNTFSLTPDTGITMGLDVSHINYATSTLSVTGDSEFVLTGPANYYWKFSDDVPDNLDFQLRYERKTGSNGAYTQISANTAYQLEGGVNNIRVLGTLNDSAGNGNVDVGEFVVHLEFFTGTTANINSPKIENTLHVYPIKLVNRSPKLFVTIGARISDNGTQTTTSGYTIDVPRDWRDLGDDYMLPATQLEKVEVLSNTLYELKAEPVEGAEQFVYFDSNHSITSHTQMGITKEAGTTELTFYMRDENLQTPDTEDIVNKVSVIRYRSGNAMTYDTSNTGFTQAVLFIRKPKKSQGAPYFYVAITNDLDNDIEDYDYVNLVTHPFSDLPSSSTNLSGNYQQKYFRVSSNRTWSMFYTWTGSQGQGEAPFSADTNGNTELYEDGVGTYRFIMSGGSGETYFIINHIPGTNITQSFTFQAADAQLVNSGQGSIVFNPSGGGAYGTVTAFTITDFRITQGVFGGTIESDDPHIIIDYDETTSTANAIMNGIISNGRVNKTNFTSNRDNVYGMFIVAEAQIKDFTNTTTHVFLGIHPRVQNDSAINRANLWCHVDSGYTCNGLTTATPNGSIEFSSDNDEGIIAICDTPEYISGNAYGWNTPLSFVYALGGSQNDVTTTSNLHVVDTIIVKNTELNNAGLTFRNLFEAWFGEPE